MKLRTLLYAVAVVAIMMPGCRTRDETPIPKGALLATVNGVAITEDDLVMRLQGGHGTSMTPETRKRGLEDIIDEELLYQQGLKLGLDRDAKYQNAVRIMEQRLKEFKRAEMARRVKSTQIEPTVSISNEDVRRYYDEHADAITTDLHLAAVRFPDEAKARAAWDRIRKGAAFETIAGELQPQRREDAKPSWDMGTVPWNQVPLEWTDAIYALKKGDVSGVLSGKRNGLFIVKVLDRIKNPGATPEKMNASIMMRLRDERIARAYERYLNDLKREARIDGKEGRRKTS